MEQWEYDYLEQGENYIFERLQNGKEDDWEKLKNSVTAFPKGQDEITNTPWIIHAIDSGSIEAIQWMLNQDIALDFEADDGFPVLHSALCRENEDKYEILTFLLEKGAPVNQRGLNDWTPLHRAAFNNDLKALKILLKFGADPNLSTRIDLYATPLAEARYFKQTLSNFWKKFPTSPQIISEQYL